MSAETTGVQPHTMSEKNEQPHAANRPMSPSDEHHLRPDLPPQPMAASGDTRNKRPRGFAAMDRKVVSEIARKGGKAAHSAGTAHEFTSEEARVAGRKGGRATHAKRRQGGDEPSGESQPENAQEGGRPE